VAARPVETCLPGASKRPQGVESGDSPLVKASTASLMLPPSGVLLSVSEGKVKIADVNTFLTAWQKTLAH
jgi:hypothetical protein